VAPDRLRFDITHFAPMGKEELERVEALVNQKIRGELEIRDENHECGGSSPNRSHGTLWRKVRRKGQGGEDLGLQHGTLRRDPQFEDGRYRSFLKS